MTTIADPLESLIVTEEEAWTMRTHMLRQRLEQAVRAACAANHRHDRLYDRQQELREQSAKRLAGLQRAERALLASDEEVGSDRNRVVMALIEIREALRD